MWEGLSIVMSVAFVIRCITIGVFPVARAKPIEEGAEGGHAGGNEGEVVLDTAARMYR